MSNFLWHQPQTEWSVVKTEEIDVSSDSPYTEPEFHYSESNSPFKDQCEPSLGSVPLENYFDWSEGYGSAQVDNQYWPNYDQETKTPQNEFYSIHEVLEYSCDTSTENPDSSSTSIKFPVRNGEDFDSMDDVLRDNLEERIKLIRTLKNGQAGRENKLQLLRDLLYDEAVVHIGVQLNKKQKKTKKLNDSTFFKTVFDVWTDDKADTKWVVEKFLKCCRRKICNQRKKTAALRETVSCSPPPNWEKTLRDLFTMISVINSQLDYDSSDQ